MRHTLQEKVYLIRTCSVMKAAEKIKVRRIVMYRGHNTDTVIAKASKVPARLAWLVVKGKTKRA